jgi:hypothetical protein
MQPKQNAPKINNIETWTNAFIVYTSIYCGIHVNQFRDLLKYMSMVRLGASRTIGWVGSPMTNNSVCGKHKIHQVLGR